jgi:N-acetylglucosamine-6-phosphate deacetylase
VGADADFCFFNDDLDLQEVIAKGKLMMLNGKILPINEV